MCPIDRSHIALPSYDFTATLRSRSFRSTLNNNYDVPVIKIQHNQRQFIKISRNILVMSIIKETKSNFRRYAKQSVTASEDE